MPDGGAQELVDSCPTLLGQRFAVDQHQCGYTVVFTVMAQPMTVLPALLYEPCRGSRSGTLRSARLRRRPIWWALLGPTRCG